MKNLLEILLAVFILFNVNEIKSAPFDTGMTELQQPDETTFIGRIWGDEFFYWAETEDGYRFVQSGDGWYYYATLDQNGEYAPTNYKVGIDTPPISSYQLERSQARLDEIKQRIEEFGEAVERAGEWYAQKQAEAHEHPVILRVGVILIEFQDVKHYKTDPQGNRPDGYYAADFDSMMFSYNYWVGDAGNPRHPEEEAIFGSFRDYWHQISRGKLRIEGRVVNPTDENGVPEWLTADYNRNVYYNLYYKTLASEAINKAQDSGWISLTSGDPKYYDKLAIVFARNSIKFTNLFTYADPDSHYIQVSERCSEELWANDDYTFTHMGVYAHEFGHNLGFKDEYMPTHPSDMLPSEGWQEDGNTDTYNFDLMSWGIYNGPLRKGECPATLSPYYRISKNWINSILVNQDYDDFLVEYNYEKPNVYRINPISAIEDEHFLFESRGRDGFDKYLPWSPNDTINQPGRLIVWYHNMKWVYQPIGFTATDRSRIINADNTRHWFSQLTDFFPDNFNPGIQDFNDISVPATVMGFYFSPELGNLRLAHFALNGIENVGYGNTIINEVRPNHAMVKNVNSGGWQTLSVPVGLSDYSLSSVFPTAISAFKFNGLYIQVSTLENGPGYWINFPSGEQNTILAGDPIEYLEIPLSTGWNITGMISDSVRVTDVCTDPPEIIEYIYGYNNGYILMTEDSTLIPGKGYWTKSTNSGTMFLERYAEPCELLKLNSFPQINLAEMDKFIITDSAGFSQTLYVSNTDIDTAMINVDLDLPPFFGQLDFDSRFEHNEFVKKVSADSGMIDLNILVQTNAFPVSLSWELNPENGINYSFINDSGTGKISAISDFGKTTFNQLPNNIIRLFAKVDETMSNKILPKEFSLEQNYPNPFNPITTIKYDIVKAQDVKVIVYDILGSEIVTLVNEQQLPGRYEVKWDASNVSSGIYFYQLKTKDYVDTKKMILLR